MKIALVSPYDITWPGGVTAHISYLAREFVYMGHQVKILAPHTPSRAVGLDSENFFSLGRSVPVPSGGSIARLSLSVWMYPRVRRCLADGNFDIVHFHEPLAPYLFMPLATLQNYNAVNVGTFHAFHESTKLYRIFTPFIRQWFDRLDGRIVVSPMAKLHVQRLLPGNNEFSEIPNGIDLSQFSGNMDPVPEFMDGKINILFVGRLEKRKGLNVLLDAYARLKWNHPSVRILVVGPGNPDKKTYRIITERNLKDVIFVGGVSPTQLVRYYQTAHIFCSPATGKESFGIVLLEAMAAGKPIVASRIGGYSLLLKDGHQGLLVPPNDGAALADALSVLVRNSELRRVMGERGLQYVQQYSWTKVAQRVMQYYIEVIRLRDRAGIKKVS